MTDEGSVKLLSFFFEEDKTTRKIVGQTNELALLYELKSSSNKSFNICVHPFANFIFFQPGVLLFMVDSYPRIYYPVIAKQLPLSFDEYLPNQKK
jgi:hypothetical protein